ncbi:MAG: DUF5719 family protein [Arachnia sp.]
MMRNIGTIALLLALLGVAFTLTSVTPMPLPRAVEVAAPVESKLVCAPMSEAGVLFFDGAEAITSLGQERSAAAGATIVEGFDEPAILTGGAGLAGLNTVRTTGARAYVPCTTPRSSGTIVVPGTASTDLLIVNPDASEAIVDLALYGVDGEVVAVGARGIAVGPYASRTIALSVLGDVAGPVGVVHSASTGRATVVARSEAPGMLEAATSSSAGTEHLLAGIPANATTASLLVTNPGAGRATLQVEALGEALVYTPEGGADLTVEPYSTTSVDLAQSLAGEATGLHIASDVDVAVALSTGLDTDPAAASPVPASTELGAFAPAGGTLQLSNPGNEDAEVEITVDVIDSEPTVSTQIIPAGVTMGVPMAATAARGQTVSVISDGPLFGAIVDIADGATILPLTSLEAPEPTAVDAELASTLR